MTHRPTRTALALAAAMTLTAGCSISENVKRAEGEIDATAERTDRLEAGQTLNQRDPRGVQRSDSLWLGLDEREDVREIPPALKRDFAVKETFDSVIGIAEHVSLTTGIPVNVSPDAIPDLAAEMLGDQVTEDGGSSGGQPPASGLSSIPSGQIPELPSVDGSDDSGALKFEADYQGDLFGFLDAVSARYNIEWRYREGRINFYRYGTDTFTIETLPGIAQGLTGIQGSSGGDSDSTLQASFNTQGLDVWGDLESTVGTMLSEKGEVTVSPSIGKITATDIPSNLRRVGDYIDSQNQSLSKSVAVDITVISYSADNSEDYGVDWSILTDGIASNVAGTIQTATQAGEVTGDTFSFSVDPESGAAISGSEAVIDALSTQGNVSVVTSGSVTTLNNRPAPIRSGRSTTYLESQEVTVSENATEVELSEGEFSTGFSAQVLPHILPNNEILLEYGVNLRSLIELAEISSSDGTRIQAPDIAVDEFVQQMRLNNGETVVTGGFLQSRSSVDRQGVGSTGNVLAGNTASEQVEDRLFIIVEPVLQD